MLNIKRIALEKIALAASIALCLATAPLTPAFAAGHTAEPEISLRAGYPNRYIVEKGDTLWDIAGRFLQNPWQWKTLWRGNPAIENPHLIYPGDILSLVYVNGRPALKLQRTGLPVVKLSPSTRASSVSGAVLSLPVSNVKDFLINHRIAEAEELRKAAYILSPASEGLIIYDKGARAYARGITSSDTRVFGVYELGQEIVDPDAEDDKASLGKEAIYVGEVRLVRTGEPSTVEIIRARREILRGHILLPSEYQNSDLTFQPTAAPRGLVGKVLDFDDGTMGGRFSIVYLNVGREHGVTEGSVFNLMRTQGKIKDTKLIDPSRVSTPLNRDPAEATTEIELPYERHGSLMVFRVYDKLSIASVMNAAKPVEVGDLAVSPVGTN